MKRPSFQFYPGDWLKDASLRMCSVGARGLWIDMLCIMHQGSPYGYLKVNDKVIHVDNLTRMVGSTTQEVGGWLQELESAGVFSRDDDGCIISRRMIRDEELRAVRAAGGVLGGNPALKTPKKEVGEKVNHPANLKPTPSSSSSSSPSGNSLTASPPAKRKCRLPDNFFPDETGQRKAGDAGIMVSVELERFRDYHTGRGTTMLDWQAAWRTWVGNCVKFAKTPKQTKSDATVAKVAQFIGRTPEMKVING